MAESLQMALQAGPLEPPPLDFNGAERTAQLLHALLTGRDHASQSATDGTSLRGRASHAVR
jgi:hypothetical protein